MTIYKIPRANAPIAGTEAPTIQWYNYLNYLSSQTSPSDLQAQIDALSAEIAKIPGGFNLKTIDSIAMTGNSGVGGLVQLSLVGDVNAPSALSFYGSVPSNDAGWYTFSSNFADNAGSLDLSQPTIGSGGTLALLGFDAYGRLSETAPASTTNLPEGTNLYYTDKRAKDAVGAAIAAGTQEGISVVYNSGPESIDFIIPPTSFDAKPAVAYASTSALPANTYSNGSSGVGATLTGTVNGPLVIDGVTLVIGNLGERVLVAAEGASANNGWYTITQIGVIAVSPYILTRTTESDQGSEIGPGYLTGVEVPSGLTPGSNNGKVFISVAPTPFVVGTSALTFSIVGGTYSAGTGITITGTTINISNTAVTPGTYGSGTQVAQFTVNAQGQITGASNITISGGGSVSSVGLTAPSIFTVSGSPITASGTLALALTTQNAGLVFAGPVSGTAAVPNFRSIAVTDINFGVNLLTDQAGNQLTDQSGNDLTDNGLSLLPVSVTGNAATATTLQTPVTINGVSFNGGSNITIPSSGKVAEVPYTSSGTFPIPLTTTSVRIYLWAKGGDGGAGTASSGAGGGGGGGGFTRGVYPVTPGGSLSVTIGSTCSVTGMLSGTCTATQGTNGSNGAAVGALGGTGGIGLGGSFNVTGNPGGPSYSLASTSISGLGGSTFASSGAPYAIGSVGGFGTFPGGGASGGSGVQSGGTGGGALCIIEYVQ